MAEITKEYIAGALVVTLIALAGSIVYNVQDTGTTAVCRNGVWQEYNATHYMCTTNNDLQICHHLSSTAKTCYIGRIISVVDNTQSQQDNQNIISTGEYRCYPEKGYCRLKGLLTNPKVPINEVPNVK